MRAADEGSSSFHPARQKPARSPWRPWLLMGALALVLMIAYAVIIEPKRLEVTHQSLTGRVTQKLRIAHITDLHTQGFGPRERTLVLMLRRENPDIIVITGDTVDGPKLSVVRDFMVNLSAPLGVWVVRGNWEHWKLEDDERAFYTSVGARFLENTGAAARSDVWVAGLDDPMTGTPNLTDALFGAPADAFKLVLMHAPDYFAQIGGQFDLALAGHTHGGQIVLPFWGPLWLPEGGKRYLAGFYSQNNSLLYVSRGIGTSIAPIRFGARPELAIIDITPR
ncbi:MAG TPA: metallophosphoesterase [Polyangia bacterium]